MVYDNIPQTWRLNRVFLAKVSGKIHFKGHPARKLSRGFLTEQDSNQSVQLHRLAKNEILH